MSLAKTRSNQGCRRALHSFAFFATLTLAASSSLFAPSSLAISRHSDSAATAPDFDPERWHQYPSSRESLEIEAERETAVSKDGLDLALKHYRRKGAVPVLLIHGLAQNDRIWDAKIEQYSFARFLHAQGFDVWMGNLRAAGTPGFRSDTPRGAHHWTIDDYAVNDIPALVERVRKLTGQAPFVAGHSLAAWALEGYLAGLDLDANNKLFASDKLGRSREKQVRGIITIAGVYALRWEHPLEQARSNPIRSVTDYYHSNYELQLMAETKLFFQVVPLLYGLPLSWINPIVNVPVSRIPIIGSMLEKLYINFQYGLVRSPLFTTFYYEPNVDQEMVRQHVSDGMEDLGPHLVEQLGNAINDHRTSSYYHMKWDEEPYQYSSVRDRGIDVPLLFVGGGRDRLASALEIYEDGYLKTKARDKEYVFAELFGHMDILDGIHAARDVMTPVAAWMQKH
jgi:pimeloyl-ACP methyl ester carboxylesterase